MAKDDGAFLTIGELAQDLGIAQHILRYWETRFPQLRPLQRSGNRRYYRPRDVEVARLINRLLNDEGFTVRGAQRVLSGRKDVRPELADESLAAPIHVERVAPVAAPAPQNSNQGVLPIGDMPPAGAGKPLRSSTVQVAPSDLALLIARLTVIRQNLVEALESN
jgi:DNA-binding transcriptional MerR regulator